MPVDSTRNLANVSLVCAKNGDNTEGRCGTHGLIQTLVSDYERGRLRLAADMIVVHCGAGDHTDDTIDPRPQAGQQKVSRKVLRRLEQIEGLPAYQQRALLTTIDNFIAAAQDR